MTGDGTGTDLLSLARAGGEMLWPVHRIDNVTSGVVLLAKTLEAHRGLTRQFNRRTVKKSYLAVTRSAGLPEDGTIDLPLAAGRKGRVRVAAPRDRIVHDPAASTWRVAASDVLSTKKAYPSETRFVRVLEREGHTLLLVEPVTGRRHQIRVHLAWIGHPIAGDPLFGDPGGGQPYGRAHLHSWRLKFDASWSDGTPVDVTAPPPPGFFTPLGDVDVAEIDRRLAATRALPPAVP